MSIKINKQFVDELEFPNIGQKIYRDCEITGFCVRVTPNSKTYIVDKKYNNKLHRVVIGSSNNILAVGARKKAQIVLAQIYSGEFVSKSKNNDAFNLLDITVGTALDIYLNKNAFKPKTVRQYNKSIDLYLQGWRKRKFFDISKDQLLNKFLDTSEVSPSSTNGAISLIGTLWKYMHVLYSTDDKPIMKSNPMDIIAVTMGGDGLELNSGKVYPNLLSVSSGGIQSTLILATISILTVNAATSQVREQRLRFLGGY